MLEAHLEEQVQDSSSLLVEIMLHEDHILRISLDLVEVNGSFASYFSEGRISPLVSGEYVGYPGCFSD